MQSDRLFLLGTKLPLTLVAGIHKSTCFKQHEGNFDVAKAGCINQWGRAVLVLCLNINPVAEVVQHVGNPVHVSVGGSSRKELGKLDALVLVWNRALHNASGVVELLSVKIQRQGRSCVHDLDGLAGGEALKLSVQALKRVVFSCGQSQRGSAYAG